MNWFPVIIGILLLIALLIIVQKIVLHIKDAPRRQAEEALKEGRIVEGLCYFWQNGDFYRIRQFIGNELRLPDTSWWGRFWRADPQFRQLVSKNYATILTLIYRANDKSNAIMTDDMKASTVYHATKAAKYLFSTCQQISCVTRNGEFKIKNNSLRPSFIALEERLVSLQSKVVHAQIEMDKYVLSPHQNELQMADIFRGFDEFSNNLNQQRQIETELVQEFLQ
jgi:hypothetical protein